MKVLLIEDEKALAKSIQQYLQDEGILCEWVSSFEEAWMRSGVYEYDCILVDITLPGGSGLEIVQKLKRDQIAAGIIIISARDKLDDKIHGLELGADDYLAKPFHLSELNARIKALVRRKEYGGNKQVGFGEVTIFPEERRVEVNGKELTLTKSELELLLYFLVNRNRVLSKESIAEHLLGDSADSMDNFDFLYSHVKNLRRKLLDAGAGDYIGAVYGVGYRFAMK